MDAGSRGRMAELGNWTESRMVRKWPEWRGFEEQGRQEAGKGPGMSLDSQGQGNLSLESEVISQPLSLTAFC